MLSRGFVTALTFCTLAFSCVFLAGTIGARPQPVSRFERRLPIPINSTVTLSNASSVSIEAWNKGELYVAAESSAGKVDEQEIKIESNNDALNIVCQSSRPNERISVTLYAPDKSTVYLNTGGNKIEVKKPQW